MYSSRPSVATFAACLLTLASACADRAAPYLPTVCPGTLPDGTCVGVTQPDLCVEPYCDQAAGLSCSRTWYVDAAALPGGDGTQGLPLETLAQAASSSAAGECIALTDGQYTGATLAGGVSLLGTGADRVIISSSSRSTVGLGIKGASRNGRNGLVRGVSLATSGAGLALSTLEGLRVEQVRISAVGQGIDARDVSDLSLRHVELLKVSTDAASGAGIGLLLAEGSTARVERTLIQKAGTQGVLVHGASLNLRDSAVLDSGYIGVAVDCTTGCTGLPATELRDARIEGSGATNLLSLQARLSVVESTLSDNRYVKGHNICLAAKGGELALIDSRVERSAGVGIHLDGTRGTLSGNSVQACQSGGISVQDVNAPDSVTLTNNRLQRNQHFGVRIVRSAATIEGGRVSETKSRLIPIGSSSTMIGDGVQLLYGSTVTVRSLRIEKSGRVGLLVDDSRATLRQVVIGASQAPLVVQHAVLSDQVLDRVTNPDGKAVTPVVSKTYPTGLP